MILCSSTDVSESGPNDHLTQAIISALHASISSATNPDSGSSADPRTELDSHANMVVLGKDSFIFESTGRTCNVRPFASELGIAENVPIVDGAIAYDCPYTSQSYILLVRNALHIPSMHINLIPPFIMRAGGVTVNDIPKIHVDDPCKDDHCLIFPHSDLRIPLQLNGTFSYFHTRLPTTQELYDLDKVFLTPDSEDWNPHCESFEKNERAMTNYEGEMNDLTRRSNLPMVTDDNDEDLFFNASSVTCDALDSHLDAVASSAYCDDTSTLERSDHDTAFSQAISTRCEISKFGTSVGSCSIDNASCPLFSPMSSDLHNIESKLEPLLTSGELSEVMSTISSASASRSSGVTASRLSKLWMIDESLAEGVIERNTQLRRQNADNTLSRNFSTNDRMLRYRRIQSTFFTDTLFATPKAKSLRQNTCCQLFVSDKGFVSVYPMRSQEDFDLALHWFCKQVGVPVKMVMDAHRSQKKLDTKRFCDQVGTMLQVLERGSPWSNRAEMYIGLMKEAVRKDMRLSNSPMVLWDYCIERRALIHNTIPRPLFQTNGLTPHEFTLGVPADISNLCLFGWYEWIYYRDADNFPENKEKLGRILGPVRNEGNEMAQSVLTSKGTVITRRTMRRLKTAELHSESEKKKRAVFDALIDKKLGNSMAFPSKPDPKSFIPYSDDSDGEPELLPEDNDPLDKDGSAMFEKPITDQLIHAEVHLPQGDSIKAARVIGRSKDSNGQIIGVYDENPLLNTLVYDVEFPDGDIKEYSANVIAENMYAQVDPDGHVHTLLDAIISYDKSPTALAKCDMYITTKSGQQRLRHSTTGWKFEVLWKDGSSQWVPLKELKASNPIELAEFAVANGIDDEAAFKWWVPFTLRKRDRIISSVNSRVRKVSHKYGIEIPSSIKEAYALDTKNGNSFWRDAINKEMENLKVAFDILPDGKSPPVHYTKASGHLVFDVRMTLERKARWVKDGHRTPEPDHSTYAGVVSRESIRIALTYAALNNLQVFGADIQNAYLQAPTSERHYIICGPEFGLENVGKKALIVRALYGGKSAGADYWRHVRAAMDDMGFESCKADPDVWMQPGVKDDGVEYWEYVLLYTDDILAIMTDPESFLRHEIGTRFTLKEKSIGPPSQYLGNKVSKVTLSNNVSCWSFSSSQYIQNAVQNVEDHLQSRGEKLPARAKSPWSYNYRPETDISPTLSPTDAAYFQSLIGVLRWIVELGRADIAMETSALASMMAAPRIGHLQQVFRMFAFLKVKHNGVMVFDPTVPAIDESQFAREDWSATAYGECREEIPPNAPSPRGIGFTMRAFVDSDHAGDVATRRSRTGFFIFLNSAPIYWFTKKQTSIETSSFGSEFIAMKQCCEYIRGLRYKLRMMGISVELPTFIFGDNQSVLANTSKPHSTLKKKSSSIAFHFVREGCAKDEWRTTYLNTHFNPSDILTKSLPGGEKRDRFTSYILHYTGANDAVD